MSCLFHIHHLSSPFCLRCGCTRPSEEADQPCSLCSLTPYLQCHELSAKTLLSFIGYSTSEILFKATENGPGCHSVLYTSVGHSQRDIQPRTANSMARDLPKITDINGKRDLL